MSPGELAQTYREKFVGPFLRRAEVLFQIWHRHVDYLGRDPQQSDDIRVGASLLEAEENSASKESSDELLLKSLKTASKVDFFT
ncbi:MAG: hypothetical protein WB999_07990 [Candidatus Binataceae bacterium]